MGGWWGLRRREGGRKEGEKGRRGERKKWYVLRWLGHQLLDAVNLDLLRLEPAVERHRHRLGAQLVVQPGHVGAGVLDDRHLAERPRRDRPGRGR